MFRYLIGMLGIGALLASTASYQSSIRAWQKQRDAGLRAPDGWLTLVGLFWLKEGNNTIGSGGSNDFVLPESAAAERTGVLQLHGKKVVFRSEHGDARELSYDEEHPDVVRDGTISFYVIQRGDKFAVRAKDSAALARKRFSGMKYFPINAELHVEGKFVADSKKIAILNILGQTDLEESPGVVEFRYQGQTYRLRPIYEGKTLFFLFKDRTNRSQTYQAGRMLNTPLPVDGKVDLDFNRAYNPPCTFTPYATCPLPPKENTLPFAVNAGELRYGQGHPELSAAR